MAASINLCIFCGERTHDPRSQHNTTNLSRPGKVKNYFLSNKGAPSLRNDNLGYDVYSLIIQKIVNCFFLAWWLFLRYGLLHNLITYMYMPDVRVSTSAFRMLRIWWIRADIDVVVVVVQFNIKVGMLSNSIVFRNFPPAWVAIPLKST